MPETWTVRRVLGWTADHFERHHLDSPRLTAEVLLAHALKMDRVHLYLDLERPLEARELDGFRSLIRQRTEGRPTQYLVGTREFYGRPFLVDPRVLIPRPETELLVEEVLGSLPPQEASSVLDIGTGSGCIAATIGAERPKASVWATEISPRACQVARSNVHRLELGARVTVLEGDLFEPLPSDLRLDVIVSNPPYVTAGELAALPAEVQQEPIEALDGGEDGLEVTRRIIEQSRGWLRPGGLLALEISEIRGPEVLGLLKSVGYANPRISKDLARLDRFAYGTATG